MLVTQLHHHTPGPAGTAAGPGVGYAAAGPGVGYAAADAGLAWTAADADPGLPAQLIMQQSPLSSNGQSSVLKFKQWHRRDIPLIGEPGSQRFSLRYTPETYILSMPPSLASVPLCLSGLCHRAASDPPVSCVSLCAESQ